MAVLVPATSVAGAAAIATGYSGAAGTVSAASEPAPCSGWLQITPPAVVVVVAPPLHVAAGAACAFSSAARLERKASERFGSRTLRFIFRTGWKLSSSIGGGESERDRCCAEAVGGGSEPVHDRWNEALTSSFSRTSGNAGATGGFAAGAAETLDAGAEEASDAASALLLRWLAASEPGKLANSFPSDDEFGFSFGATFGVSNGSSRRVGRRRVCGICVERLVDYAF